MRCPMRIRRNGKAAALAPCGAGEITWQIEAFWTGIDLEPHSAFSGFGRNAFEIEWIAFTLQQQPSRQMTKNAERRGFQRSQKTVCHLLPLDIEITVHTSNHQ